MTLEKHIERFGTEFVSIPVTNIRYWEDLEMYLGEILIGDARHPEGSSICFEFYDQLTDETAIAYKPLSCYHK